MKLSLLTLLTILATSAHAVEPSLYKNFEEDTKEEKDFSSHITFDYGQFKMRVDHQETSSDSGFKSFGNESDYIQSQVGTSYLKELFHKSRVSLTGLVKIGANLGNQTLFDGGSSKEVDSQELLTGYYYGAGATINLNFEYGKHKIQPFVGGISYKSTNTYFLRYEDVGTDSRSFEIEYTEEATVTEGILGIRVHNLNTGYMSTIAVSSLSITQDNLKADATQGDTTFKLSKEAEFEFDSTALRISFAFPI